MYLFPQITELPDRVKLERFTLRQSDFDARLANPARRFPYVTSMFPVRGSQTSDGFSTRISTLPMELLQMIFAHLDLISLHQLAAVDTNIRATVLSGKSSFTTSVINQVSLGERSACSRQIALFVVSCQYHAFTQTLII